MSRGKKQTRGNPLGGRKCQVLVGKMNGMMILTKEVFDLRDTVVNLANKTNQGWKRRNQTQQRLK